MTSSPSPPNPGSPGQTASIRPPACKSPSCWWTRSKTSRSRTSPTACTGNGASAKDKDEGLLLLLAIKDHKQRAEVGYGLEGTIPDIYAGQVLRGIRPILRQGNYGGALIAAVQQFGSRIAQEKGVSLQPMQGQAAPGASNQGSGGFLPVIIVIILVILVMGWMGRHGGGGGGFLAGMILGDMMGGRGGGGWGGGEIWRRRRRRRRLRRFRRRQFRRRRSIRWFVRAAVKK